MRIVSREAFADVLGEATRRTEALSPASWPLLQQVAAQLDFMARATAHGRIPPPTERARTTLGPLAARNLENTDPVYADQLEELDYTFHRYPLLAPGPPIRRRGILQIWSGRDSFNKLILDPCAPKKLGRADADLIIGGDPTLGAPHCQIVWDGVCAHVHAFEPHRLTVNGEPTWLGELANRGWMTAGDTTLRFLVEDRTPPPAPVAPTDESRAALVKLAPLRDAGTLYAVIDAARSERALQLIEESVDRYASLYDGEQGRAYDDVAPYLVQLRKDSGLLDRLVTEGWGHAWGIYADSPAEFDAVRRHLRQFLMIEAEGEPHRLFFRFYDPRVLRTFADVITPEQRAEFMKPLTVIYFEADATPGTIQH